MVTDVIIISFIVKGALAKEHAEIPSIVFVFRRQTV